MGSRKIYSKIPTSIDQLLKLPVPSELSQLFATLTAEGIAQDVLIHSFYSVLIEHSGRSSLKEKLLDTINSFINEDLIDLEVCERLCETLDALFDARTRGVDRYDIPAFLRRSTD